MTNDTDMVIATLVLAIAFVSEPAPNPASSPYPTAAPLVGAPAKPVLDTRRARMFRTQLRRQAAEGPNFNGHFSLAWWGCGTGCIEMAVIDLETGRVHMVPQTLVPPCVLPTLSSSNPKWIDVRVDSAIFHLNQCTFDDTCAENEVRRWSYVWTGHELRRLRAECVPWDDPGKSLQDGAVALLRQRLAVAEPRVVSVGYRTVRLFAPDELDAEQLGYARDPDGHDLTGTRKGDWQPSWLAVGHEDETGDPLFVDTRDDALAVYTAAHGMGHWEPELLAASFDGFVEGLRVAQRLGRGRSSPVELEHNPLTDADRRQLQIDLACLGSARPLPWWTSWFDAQ